MREFFYDENEIKREREEMARLLSDKKQQYVSLRNVCPPFPGPHFLGCHFQAAILGAQLREGVAQDTLSASSALWDLAPWPAQYFQNYSAEPLQLRHDGLVPLGKGTCLAPAKQEGFQGLITCSPHHRVSFCQGVYLPLL